MMALVTQHSIGEPSPIGVSAQDWTSDEQALIEAKHCWDRAGNDPPTRNHVAYWTLLSQDFRPIQVKAGNDFGVIYFHGIRLWEAADGTRDSESWRGFEVWKRTPGGWSFHRETGTPDGAEPSPLREPVDPAVPTRDCFYRGRTEGKLKAQIPWLRVFVEGVVIVGKLEH